MRVAISGASGLVGRELSESLIAAGHRVQRLVRGSSIQGPPLSTTDLAAGEIAWDPQRGVRDLRQLEATDAIVHLAGRSIALSRWTDNEKRRIRDSRVQATAQLVAQVCQLERKPRVFVCASATGYYGDTEAAAVDESTPPGDGFLATVARDWEAACQPLAACGVRVVHARFGMILSKHGGALKKILPLFRWRLAGKIGSGTQMWSWIALQDCVRALTWFLTNDSAEGPYNVVSPQAVTNAQFTRHLAQTLNRSNVIAVPKIALRIALGEMADALLLSSSQAVPKRLREEGFEFNYPDLERFLVHELRNRT